MPKEQQQSAPPAWDDVAADELVGGTMKGIRTTLAAVVLSRDQQDQHFAHWTAVGQARKRRDLVAFKAALTEFEAWAQATAAGYQQAREATRCPHGLLPPTCPECHPNGVRCEVVLGDVFVDRPLEVRHERRLD